MSEPVQFSRTQRVALAKLSSTNPALCRAVSKSWESGKPHTFTLTEVLGLHPRLRCQLVRANQQRNLGAPKKLRGPKVKPLCR